MAKASKINTQDPGQEDNQDEQDDQDTRTWGAAAQIQ